MLTGLNNYPGLSAGIESGINFVFCMNPLMCAELGKAEFIEADVTYNETKEYISLPFQYGGFQLQYNELDGGA